MNSWWASGEESSKEKKNRELWGVYHDLGYTVNYEGIKDDTSMLLMKVRFLGSFQINTPAQIFLA